MSIAITEKDLPAGLTPEQAVEAAYAQELAEIASKLVRGLPVLVECDKELAPYMYMNLRGRLREAKLQCIYLDGRQREGQQQGAMPMGLIGTMISQLRDAVRGAVERRVVVLPHLDLLTTSQGGLTGEAREVIPLLYENPELVWLGFKDPSFSLPKVIENLFPHWVSILGISRSRLRHLITQKESRKFGKTFSPWQLYKYVSGVNAVRLRKLLSTLEGEDYPADAKKAYGQVRQATLSGSMEIPPSIWTQTSAVQEGQAAAHCRDPRRAVEARQGDRRRRDRAPGGTHPPGHDLLGPAGHREDVLRQGDCGEHRSRDHDRVRPGTEVEVGR